MNLEDDLAAWGRESRRFRAFDQAHVDKIRKKLRSARDEDTLLDLRAELNVARLLLAERRFVIAYEAYGVGRVGPDFTVTFRGTERFNIEVTRLRGDPSAEAVGRSIVAKLRQLPSGAANVLIAAVDVDRVDATVVRAAVATLRRRADRGEPSFLTAAGYRDARAFYDRFLRLGAVVVWAETATGDERAAVWVNPSARITVPPRALRACVGALRSPVDSGPARGIGSRRGSPAP